MSKNAIQSTLCLIAVTVIFLGAAFTSYTLVVFIGVQRVMSRFPEAAQVLGVMEWSFFAP